VAGLEDQVVAGRIKKPNQV